MSFYNETFVAGNEVDVAKQPHSRVSKIQLNL